MQNIEKDKSIASGVAIGTRRDGVGWLYIVGLAHPHPHY